MKKAARLGAFKDKNRGFPKTSVLGKINFAWPASLNLYEKAGLGPLVRKFFPKLTGFFRSLLRFAHKITKNRLKVDFLPCKLRSDQRSAEPDNRGFDGFFNGKGRKNLQVQQAARILVIYVLFYYVCFPGGFPVSGRVKAEAPAEQNAGNGMGGGVTPEQISASYVEVFGGEVSELLGVPEPEEYSKPHPLVFASYTVKEGDMIGNIAVETGLSQSTIISINGIKNTRTLQIGQTLRIPNQDGIYYTVQKNDTLLSIAEKYRIDPGDIRIANELFSDVLQLNAGLFLPGARLGSVELQEINGDLFIWPVAGYITSPYGYRANPFGGQRQFHSGLDIGAVMGTPVKAAMTGRVSTVGYDDALGNYAVISHHSGYRTLYAHMSSVRVQAGAYVPVGQVIGDVGSTGISTGPHLHFTVYKNGVTVNPRSLMK
jgi:murein DD-endopeptidase MepM/ murein hydrolase activator NlpD